MITINLLDDVTSLTTVNTRWGNVLNKNGIYTIGNLINNFPKKVIDNHLTNSLLDNEKQTIKAFVNSDLRGMYNQRKMHTTQFEAVINSETIKVIIFNRAYIQKYIKNGMEVYLIGKYNIRNNTFVCQSIETSHKEMIVVYDLEGISDNTLLNIEKEALTNCVDLIEEVIPVEFINKYRLMSINEAFIAAHFPTSKEVYKQFLRRAKYEELLMFQLKVCYAKALIKRTKNAISIKKDEQYLKSILLNIPFELTNDQKQSLNEILEDLSKYYPLNRLLQGDVGSGKTIVCMICSKMVVKNGYQTALMAPTEILASQHYATFLEYYSSNEIVLLTGSTKPKDRKEKLEKIKNGSAKVVIGTHALFSKDVEYNNLAFVITDEQHRFGVNQRKKLNDKGKNINVLYLSATPIPRTMAITYFGDMDISQIKTMPKNRKQIITKFIKKNKTEMKKVHLFIKDIINKGQQIYIVTPMIEASEKIDIENAKTVYNDFLKEYPDNCLLLHGKLKDTEKKEIYEQFLNKEKQILITTTVIEVGVDNKNATLMVILDADRFGLSQLHQLRGRVGRSEKQSYCILLSSTRKEETIDRLKVLESSSDGFFIASKDLEIRGPGELFGLKQSGNMKFKYADIQTDAIILDLARQDAMNIISKDKKITNQRIIKKVKERNYENSL